MSSQGQNSINRNWPQDEFGRREVQAQQLFWLFPIFLITLLAVLNFLPSCSHKASAVTIYCAQDQIYAEPIFRDFERATGIKVRALYDNEAVKTVGLANRLLAERSHPQCDVFWGNEELRTRQLAAQDVFQPVNPWATFGYRSRRIVINTNQLSIASGPHSLTDLTNAQWRGKVALAYPQFGTTATHFHALRQYWGDEHWKSWCRALAANQPFVVDGNSVVVQLVGRGQASVGLTDSDDIAAGQKEGMPIMPMPVTEETLLIPNTVAMIRDAPHLQHAQALFDYLQRGEVVQRLVTANALEGGSVSNLAVRGLVNNWDKVLRDLQPTTAKLNDIFLR